jgi:hypothetical protein
MKSNEFMIVGLCILYFICVPSIIFIIIYILRKQKQILSFSSVLPVPV